MLSVKEVAEELGLTPGTILNHIKQGKIPAFKVGVGYKIPWKVDAPVNKLTVSLNVEIPKRTWLRLKGLVKVKNISQKELINELINQDYENWLQEHPDEIPFETIFQKEN